MNGEEHEWPVDLASDAVCCKCGLPYGQWDERDNYWCTGQ